MIDINKISQISVKEKSISTDAGKIFYLIASYKKRLEEEQHGF